MPRDKDSRRQLNEPKTSKTSERSAEQQPSKAVAIAYDRDRSAAPRVIASGKGTIAEKIIETARQAGIHIQQDSDLVELLAKVRLGDEIPTELYQTVAEVLAFVYRLNNQYGAKTQQGPRNTMGT